MTTIASVFDDTFLHGPLGQIFIFPLFLRFNYVAREMTSDVLHAFIPTTLPLENSATKAASASLRRFPFLDPTSISNLFEAVLEGPPILGVRIVRGIWSRARSTIRFVHAPMVLGEEIFPIEVIVDPFVTRNIGVEVGVA